MIQPLGFGNNKPKARTEPDEVPAEVPEPEVETSPEPVPPSDEEGTEGLPPEKQDPKITAGAVVVKGERVGVAYGQVEYHDSDEDEV